MSRTVFVDDTDPNIKYTGDWTQLTGLPTGQPRPRRLDTPTIREFARSKLCDFRLMEYLLHIHSVVAYFQGSSTEGIVSCTVDGKSYDPGLDNGGGVHCAANVLGQGSHTIVLQVKSVWNAVLFDGMMYTTDGAPNGSDLIYYFQDASGVEDLKSPGDKLDFTFTGTSVGLYVLYWHNDALDNGPSSAQYTGDGGSPVKFTVNNSANSANPQIQPQLLIQTPTLSNGQHKFQLEFLGPGSGTRSFINFDSFIVQGSKKQEFNLEAVPSTSSSSPAGPNTGDTSSQIGQQSISSASSSPTSASSASSASFTTSVATGSSTTLTSGSSATHSLSDSLSTGSGTLGPGGVTSSTDHSIPTLTSTDPSSGATPARPNRSGMIAGIVCGILALLLLLLLTFLCLRRRQRNRHSLLNVSGDDNGLPHPFSNHNRLIYTSEKRKERERDQPSDQEGSASPGSDNSTTIQTPPGPAVVYHIHEDGGQAPPQSQPGDQERVVIELPPRYTAVLERS